MSAQADLDEIDELKASLRRLVAAMRHSAEIGCTDHLDCAGDGGAFWYDAIEEAEDLL